MSAAQALEVAVFIGSLRKQSFSRKLALALAGIARAPLHLSIVEIGHLPFFDQDLENTPPSPWVELRERIRAADAVLFVTAEYNRSVPAVLKNAIDVGSRPYGQSAWMDLLRKSGEFPMSYEELDDTAATVYAGI